MKLWIINKSFRDGFWGTASVAGVFTYKPITSELVKLLGVSELEAYNLHHNLYSDPESNHYTSFHLEEIDANTVVR